METKSDEYMATVGNAAESADQLLSGKGHILYLYAPEMDKYKIYAQVLSNRKDAVLITDEDLEKVKEILKGYKIENLTIISPALQNIAKFLCRGGEKWLSDSNSRLHAFCTSHATGAKAAETAKTQGCTPKEKDRA